MFSWSALKQMFSRVKRENWESWGKQAFGGFAAIFVGFIAASVLAAFVVQFIAPATKVRKRSRARVQVASVRLSSDLNYRDIREAVLGRNIFNSDGEVPDEVDPASGDRQSDQTFDAAAPCKKTTLALDLLGTIYLGDSASSVATIKEKGYIQADVYQVGDNIIGNEQASIHAVEQKRVILNNNGSKECIELKDPEMKPSEYAAGPPVSNQPAAGGTGSGGFVVLQEDYVRKELGDDFVAILQKGRLIPHNNQEGQLVGFKLIGANPKSLFGKVGLKTGDVITQVNDISMQQPEQGFALFQALQDETEIRISLLKSGKNPSTITVQVK